MSNINPSHLFGMPVRIWQVATLLFLALIAAAQAQTPPPGAQALAIFENTTQDYARMHRQLERQIGPIEFGTPVAEINRNMRELSAAIRAERLGAAQGDFFTPAVAGLLRARIDDALREHGFTADDVRAAARGDGVEYDRVRLKVNDTFPWVLASAMFACVIDALPPLPPELQYRIVGDELLLIDVHASLIVDILPHALMDRTAQQPISPPEVHASASGPNFIVRVIDIATRTIGDGGGDKNGLYAEHSHMVTGAGWLSIGPGYRRWFGGDRVVAEASTAMSWRSYKMARGRVELTNLLRSRVAVGSEIKWQDFTQNTYFGQGPDSLETDRSEYRVTSLNAIGYTNIRPVKWLTIGGRAGWLKSPSLREPGGRFRRDYPATGDVFPGEPAFARLDQPDYLHGEVSVTADTRDHRSHPQRGGLYRGAWTRFSDRDGGSFSFQRFEAEGAHFVSTPESRVTLAMRGWLVASDTAEGHDIPFYLMPSLGGSHTLRAFANYRFHDRHLAVANVEVRVAVLAQLDAALFVDAGNVAARMAELNFDKRSIGAGLRLHSRSATFGRVDVARGAEGWRVTVSTSDPLHLSRLSRRTAPIPFAP